MSNTINLSKGGTINLSKTNETLSLEKGLSGELKQLHVGCGWDVHSRVNADLDAFILQLDNDDQLIDKIYFGQLKSKDGAIKHTGDNLTGEGEGDDEVIHVNLEKLSSRTHKLVVAVNIYQCRTTFKDVDNAFIRILNKDSKQVLAHYNLTKESGNNYAMVLGEVVKNEDGTWSFNAIGQATGDRSIGEVVKRVTSGNVQAPTSDSSNLSNSDQSGKKGFFGKLFGK